MRNSPCKSEESWNGIYEKVASDERRRGGWIWETDLAGARWAKMLSMRQSRESFDDRRRGKIWETDLGGARWAEMLSMRQSLLKRWWQEKRVRYQKLTWREWGELQWCLWDCRCGSGDDRRRGKIWETDLARVRWAKMMSMRQSLWKRWWQEKREDMRNWSGGSEVSWNVLYETVAVEAVMTGEEGSYEKLTWRAWGELKCSLWDSLCGSGDDRRRGKIWETDLAGVRWAEMVSMRQSLWTRWWQEKREDMRNWPGGREVSWNGVYETVTVEAVMTGEEGRYEKLTWREWGELKYCQWDSRCESGDDRRRGLDMRNWPGGSEVSWNGVYETVAVEAVMTGEDVELPGQQQVPAPGTPKPSSQSQFHSAQI